MLAETSWNVHLSRVRLVVAFQTAQQMSHPRSKDGHRAYPIPDCKIIPVTLPPAEESAFRVNLIAATGVLKLP
jgi:hypothetical protein